MKERKRERVRETVFCSALPLLYSLHFHLHFHSNIPFLLKRSESEVTRFSCEAPQPMTTYAKHLNAEVWVDSEKNKEHGIEVDIDANSFKCNICRTGDLQLGGKTSRLIEKYVKTTKHQNQLGKRRADGIAVEEKKKVKPSKAPLSVDDGWEKVDKFSFCSSSRKDPKDERNPKEQHDKGPGTKVTLHGVGAIEVDNSVGGETKITVTFRAGRT